MDYEKKYKEALAHAREIHRNEEEKRRDMEWLFPELIENEDGIIREKIIAVICLFYGDPLEEEAKEMIAWLEKQKLSNIESNGEDWSEDDRTMAFTLMRDVDQMSYISKEGKNERIGWLNSLDEKFASREFTWSEEDVIIIGNIRHIISEYDKITKKANEPCWYIGDCLLWLQDIELKGLPQSKQEWSEEDEIIYAELIKYFESLLNCLATEERHNENRRWLNWLKSLKDREQPQWRPTKEQMEALRIAGEIGTANNSWAMLTLERMYQHLKKLTE